MKTLFKMIRSAEAAGDGPTSADVHPAEVENYRVAGFRFARESDEAKFAAQQSAADPEPTSSSADTGADENQQNKE